MSLTYASGFRADLQALRAVSIAGVVAYHFGWGFPGGFLGVDVFFVVSGFVIAKVLFGRSGGETRFSWRVFFRRRFYRLVPALLLMVVLTLVFVLVFFTSEILHRTMQDTALASVFGVSNFAISHISGGYFGLAPETNPLLHTWSLAVEWQFYLFFALIVWFFHKFRGSGRRVMSAPFLWTVGLLMSLSFFLTFFEFSIEAPLRLDLFGFYSPFGRFWEFGLGVLAFAVAARPDFLQRWQYPLFLLGLTIVAASLFASADLQQIPGFANLAACSGAFLVASFGREQLSRHGWLRLVLGNRPVQWIGNISYSLYLWHWPVLFFAKELGAGSGIALFPALVTSLFISALSFYFIEQPARNLGSKQSRFPILPALVMASFVPALVTLWSQVGEAYRSHIVSMGWIQFREGDIGHRTIHTEVSDNFFPCEPPEIFSIAVNWEGIERCHQSKPTGVPNVVLLGDSHAEHLFLGVAESLPERNVGFYIRSELPVYPASREMEQILDFVVDSPDIETVIIVAYWRSRGVPEEALGEFLATLRKSGKQVLLTNDLAAAPFDPSRCKASPYIGGETRCEWSRDDSDPDFLAIDRTLRSVSSSAGAEFVDTFSYFCASSTCVMVSESGSVVYRDGNHLNVRGSRELGGVVARAVDNDTH